MSRLIIIEGPDASGKSSLAKFITRQHKGTYVHMTGQIGNQARYHWNTLKWIQWNIDNGGPDIILDRCWISDKIYGPHTNPGEQGLFPYDDHDIAIQAMGGVYVLCMDPQVVERHKRERDSDHPYAEVTFQAIVQGYVQLILDWAHREDVVNYSILEHGAHMVDWVKENI